MCGSCLLFGEAESQTSCHRVMCHQRMPIALCHDGRCAIFRGILEVYREIKWSLNVRMKLNAFCAVYQCGISLASGIAEFTYAIDVQTYANCFG